MSEAPVTLSPPIETAETLRQSLLTLSTILSTITPPSSHPAVASDGPRGSAQLRPVYHLGQWVDVKDSANQWLEATIVGINSESRLMYVHYNGWPIRWDEWISWDSPRVTPFRTRTYHAESNTHSCPILANTVVPPRDPIAGSGGGAQVPVYDLQSEVLRPRGEIRELLPSTLRQVREVLRCIEGLMEHTVVTSEAATSGGGVDALEEEEDDIGDVLNDLEDSSSVRQSEAAGSEAG